MSKVKKWMIAGTVILLLILVASILCTDILNRCDIADIRNHPLYAVARTLYDRETWLLAVGAAAALICLSCAARSGAQPGPHAAQEPQRKRSAMRIAVWALLTILAVLAMVVFAGAMQFAVRDMQHERMILLEDYEYAVLSVYSVLLVLLIAGQLLGWSVYKLAQSIRGIRRTRSLYSRLPHPGGWLAASAVLSAIMLALLIRARKTFDTGILIPREVFTGLFARNEGTALLGSLLSVELTLTLLAGWLRTRLRRRRE